MKLSSTCSSSSSSAQTFTWRTLDKSPAHSSRVALWYETANLLHHLQSPSRTASQLRALQVLHMKALPEALQTPPSTAIAGWGSLSHWSPHMPAAPETCAAPPPQKQTEVKFKLCMVQ
jgi:hypothetical protein